MLDCSRCTLSNPRVPIPDGHWRLLSRVVCRRASPSVVSKSSARIRMPVRVAPEMPTAVAHAVMLHITPEDEHVADAELYDLPHAVVQYDRSGARQRKLQHYRRAWTCSGRTLLTAQSTWCLKCSRVWRSWCSRCQPWDTQSIGQSETFVSGGVGLIPTSLARLLVCSGSLMPCGPPLSKESPANLLSRLDSRSRSRHSCQYTVRATTQKIK